MSIRTESELYAPIKAFWEQRGYEVRSEIEHCDVFAVRGQEPPVIIELKKTLNLSLLVQGIQRLSYSDQVYVAFELPKRGKAPHQLTWREIRQLCGMLGLGLITVQFFPAKPAQVTILSEPQKYTLRTNSKKKKRMLTEFHARSGDYNIGGSTGKPLMTAYRERALACARLIQVQGPLSVRQMSEQTGYPQLAAMMQHNYYQWFLRVKRGMYGLTTQGEQALIEYASILPNIHTQATALPQSKPSQL